MKQIIIQTKVVRIWSRYSGPFLSL